MRRVAERDGVALRHADAADLPAIDALTVAAREDELGRGWATFMYRHVLDHFRTQGLRYAHVDTGLGAAHLAARRAYAAVGFDRAVRSVEYRQRIDARNPGSSPAP